MHVVRLAVAAVFLGGAALALADKPVDWSVEGQWLDTCNCAMPCPCWKGEKPTQKSCGDLTYFHVTKGHYGDTKLDGLDVVGVVTTPEGKSMMESTGDKSNVLINMYLPKSLPAPVAKAAEEIFGGHVVMFPMDTAKKHAVKHVAMTASMTDAGAKINIPKVLDVDVKKTKKPYAQDTKVAPFSGDSVEGVQDRYDFSDDGQTWKQKAHNASFAPFNWSSAKEKAAADAEAAAKKAAPPAPQKK
jgi:hypothetical protein